MAKSSKKGSSTAKKARALPSSITEIAPTDFDTDEFIANQGHHYDKDGKQKKQAKDLFDEKEEDVHGGWGMMMGGIEVIDASQYTLVRGPESKASKKAAPVSTSAPVPAPTDSSDDEGDPDDDSGFGSDCSISDEDCDIVILNPGESKSSRQDLPSDASEDVDEDSDPDRFAAADDFDEGDWGDSEPAENPNTKKKKGTKEMKEKQEKQDKKKASQPPLLPLKLDSPLEKKQASLSTVTSLLQNHPQTITISNTWMSHASGVTLPPLIAYNFSRLSYDFPLPIQASTLPPALLGRRDIVGCAPTGSGKTLCYGVSVLAGILSDLANANASSSNALKALILAPTRELALQVQKELQEYVKVPELALLEALNPDKPNKKKKKKKGKKKKETPSVVLPTVTILRVASLVGGLAAEKQTRVLKTCPEIIVATPGRLWELMSSNEHEHLADFSALKYLVIDEADRMVKQGNFPQLEKIFEKINEEPESDNDSDSASDSDSDSDDSDNGSGSDEDSDENENEDSSEEKEEEEEDSSEEMTEEEINKFLGFTSETSTVMLTDEILQNVQEAAAGPPTKIPTSSKSFDPIQSNRPGKLVKSTRQTFIYSATLTLPPTKSAKKTKPNKKKGRKQPEPVDQTSSVLHEIMEKAGASGQLKVIDLTSSNANVNLSPKPESKTKSKADEAQFPESKIKLPSGLTLFQTKCTKHHKDGYTYAYLTTTKQGSAGPAIVFCNSIAGVRRVGATLEALGLPTKTIHADMSQKQRMKSLETLKTPGTRCVLVATDVAARGLDIPSVASVIHYDIARSVDTFIHRSGRTARGVGPDAHGTSISLVGSNEEKPHLSICKAIRGVTEENKVIELTPAPYDHHLLTAAQERAALAEKIVKAKDSEARTAASNNWYSKTAADADLDLDENLLDETEGGSDVKDRQRFKEAQHAKKKLAKLLAKPMRKQNFGKFLGSAGAQMAMKVEEDVTPFVVGNLGGGKRGRDQDEVRLNKHGKPKRRRGKY
ncbi:hypothetical protein TrVE_jg9266 [Triparma verrucosa]|uniref:Uncharacterized protein n=1 Tax=Triparma verrucosa TaxID=1606542 RepID=A0A9W7ESP3_9STRA|nr:hypothetical protein TrVE_jg9266 [Triparma verrucosa]